MSAVPCAVEPELTGRSNLLVGVVTGTLVGFSDGGRTPLVIYPDRPGTAAVAAQSIVDLHGAHVGRSVVLMFERGDPRRPIVMGWLRQGDGVLVPQHPGEVSVDVDGERLILSAREQLVLRCGHASITLTRAGKVLVEGAYVSSRSLGVNCIQGGSVQIN